MAAPVPVRGTRDETMYRPSMLSAYRERPRGGPRSDFDPDRLRPRWRWLLAAAVLLVTAVLAGLLLRVPVGPVVVVAGVSGDDLVLAVPGLDPPARSEKITLRVGAGRTLRGTVQDLQPGAGVQITMVLLRLDSGGVSSEISAGTQMVLDRGTRPLLVDILDGEKGLA